MHSGVDVSVVPQDVAFVNAIGGVVVVSHFTQTPPQFHFMWLRSRLQFNCEICPSTVHQVMITANFPI